VNRYKVKVLQAEAPDVHVWKVAASTEDDAVQLAFALDGGWNPSDRKATEMLQLAKAYCSATRLERK